MLRKHREAVVLDVALLVVAAFLPESPYEVGGKAVFYGIDNANGDLSVIICFNNDVGDFWEWIDRPQYALRPSAEGLKLGINFVLYAMSH